MIEVVQSSTTRNLLKRKMRESSTTIIGRKKKTKKNDVTVRINGEEGGIRQCLKVHLLGITNSKVYYIVATITTVTKHN